MICFKDCKLRKILGMDALDFKLLNELQRNAKQTNKQLSLKLGLSITAVFERIRKLENDGVLKKYVALLDPQSVNRDFVVFCQIKLLQHSQNNVVTFENEISKLPEVLECYHTSGNYDYLLKVLVKDMHEFRAFMINKLTAINHIASTHSSFVINEVKQSTVIPL